MYNRLIRSSRGILRILPAVLEWIAHAVRISGKSVSGMISITPHT